MFKKNLDSKYFCSCYVSTDIVESHLRMVSVDKLSRLDWTMDLGLSIN